MAAICAFRPAGVDVNRSLRIEAVDLTIGRKLPVAKAKSPQRTTAFTARAALPCAGLRTASGIFGAHAASLAVPLFVQPIKSGEFSLGHEVRRALAFEMEYGGEDAGCEDGETPYRNLGCRCGWLQPPYGRG